MFVKSTLVALLVVSLSWMQSFSQESTPTQVTPAVFIEPNSTDATVALSGFQTSNSKPANGPVSTPNATPLIKLETLPNSAGQVWRQYDLRTYTNQISTTQNPQQAIVDWILRETGTEMWFNEPLGILSATRDQLYVYHTPEIQSVVEKVVDGFLKSGGHLQVVGVRLLTVGNPNWRATAYSMMQPIDVRSAGIEGWMISKENAAILLNQLRRRNDYVEQGGGDLTAHSGQRMVINRTRPIDFIKAIRWSPGRFPAFETIPARIDEGFSLDISAIATIDGTIEALLRCDVDQVERLQQVNVDVPDAAGGVQTVRVGVPQLLSWRLNERFRWPSDQVLLLSCGVVANPSEQTGGLGLQNLFNQSRGRADALVMIEYKGPARATVNPRQAAQSQLVPVQSPR